MQVAMTTAAIGHAKLWSHRHYKNTNTQLFTGWMPFLLPNQQCQSTEEGNGITFHGLAQAPWGVRPCL